MKRNTYFRVFASLFLLLAIALEANHSLIRRVPWNGFEITANYFSIPLIASWALALVGIWSAKATLKPLMVVGIFLLFAHSVVISSGGNQNVGVIYFFSALLAALFSAVSHTGEKARIQQSRPGLRLAS